MKAPELCLTTDAALRQGRGEAAWGAILRRGRDEWLAFGTFGADSTDEAELGAIVSALRVAAPLGLLTGGVRITSDSKRAVRACTGQAMPVYNAAMLDRVFAGTAILNEACRQFRSGICALLEGCRVRWRHIPRNSEADHRRADALAHLLLGRRPPAPYLKHLGFTAELWRRLRLPDPEEPAATAHCEAVAGLTGVYRVRSTTRPRLTGAAGDLNEE